MAALPIQIIDDFDDAHLILRSDTYRPHGMADAYRLLSKRLALDFSPTIRLLDVLPVFLHGDRHQSIRKQMAMGIAANKQHHEDHAQVFLAQLGSVVLPSQPVDWLSAVVRPLWFAMKQGVGNHHSAFLDVITQAPLLFNKKTRLRERLAINERIRTFIEQDEASAEARLISLGESVLGMTPFVSTFTLSLHTLLSGHIGKPLNTIDWPALPPSSAVVTTDRHQPSDAPNESPPIKRCILHGPHRTQEQNNRMLYGAGEHVCLGRPLANSVWSMMTAAISALPCVVQSAQLTMTRPLPSSEADYLAIQEPFQRPRSLVVTLA